MAGSAVSVPLTEWQPTASGNAQIVLTTAASAAGPALRMDFDFKGGKGFVVARRAVARTMPAEYAVQFRLRGRGAVNNLELKLIDPSGQNVWRHVLKDLKLPQRWKRFVVQSRDIEFAWGPSSGAAIAQLGFIELAIVAGEGGAGSVLIGGLEVCDLTPLQPPVAHASSAQPGFDAEQGAHGTRLEATERGPKALDHHRLHRAAHPRRAHHRLARASTGERLSCARLPRRQTLENRARGGARRGQAQLRLSAGVAHALRAPRDRAALRGRLAAARALRVFALDRGLLVCGRGGRDARLASALAASRAERMDAHRHFARHRVRAHEYRRHGGGPQGFVLLGADAARRGPVVHVGGRRGEAVARGSLDAGADFDLGGARLATVHRRPRPP